MNKTLYLCALIIGVLTCQSFAQDIRCYTCEHEHVIRAATPSYDANRLAIEAHTANFVKTATGPARQGAVYTIPVVVHVIYNTAAQNLSTAQIQSQIDVLNEDFRRMNADAANTLAQFQGVAADAELEFCLATFDPNGVPTTGITRTATSLSSFSANSDFMKFTSQGGHDAWPASDYLNLWVCNLSGSVLGFATYPGGNPALDGVVIDYQNMGRGGSAVPPFHLGRTATHEVGHWLNLIHIWGNTGCGSDDNVADTPGASGPNYGCPLSNTSCGSLDMVQNYMDYSDDSCMNLYTQGQKARMRALFAPGGSRNSILSSPGCNPASPEYQINQIAAMASVNGITGDEYSPATLDVCAGGPVYAEFSSLTAPQPYDIALSAASLSPLSVQGIQSLGGQIVNVDVAGPGFQFLSTGTGLSTLPMPWSGNFSLPFFAPPAGLTIGWQMYRIDPTHLDGIAISAACQMNTLSPSGFPSGPNQDDSSVSVDVTAACLAPVPFYGTTHNMIHISSNGRVVFNAPDSDFSPTTIEALTGDPFIGYWTDLDASSGGNISVSSPGPDQLRVAYNSVPYWGSPTTASFNLDFDVDTGVMSINAISAGNIDAAFLGLSRGNTGASDPGTAGFTPGGTGLGSSSAMLYNYCSGSGCSVLSGGLTGVQFMPSGGGYSWLGL